MRLQGTIGSSAAALDGPGAINWATRDAPQGVTAHYAASLTIADGLRVASLPPPTSAGSYPLGYELVTALIALIFSNLG